MATKVGAKDATATPEAVKAASLARSTQTPSSREQQIERSDRQAKAIIQSSPSQAPVAAESSQPKLSIIKFTRWKSDKRAEIDALAIQAAPRTDTVLDAVEEPERKIILGKAKIPARKKLEEITNYPPKTQSELDAEFDAALEPIVKAEVGVRVGGIKNPAKPPDARGEDAWTRQFNTPSAKDGGGLLMRGVEDKGETGEAFDGAASASQIATYLRSIPAEGTSQEDLKKRTYNLEKYSYVRSDTSMRVFGGRAMGFLVDPNQLREHVRHADFGKGEKELAIHHEDVQSGTESKPTTAADAKLTDQVPEKFDGIVDAQNKVKKSGTAPGNWNEVEMLSATANAYVGLFYAWPHQDDYAKVFTSERKQKLARMWGEKTGQPTLKIYLYKHGGNPSGKELTQLKEKLGSVGASELHLIETIACPVGGSSS